MSAAARSLSPRMKLEGGGDGRRKKKRQEDVSDNDSSVVAYKPDIDRAGPSSTTAPTNSSSSSIELARPEEDHIFNAPENSREPDTVRPN